MKAGTGFIGLTKREQEVMDLYIEHGCIVKVAAMLDLSPKTVTTYLTRIRDGLLLETNVQLAVRYERWKASGSARIDGLIAAATKAAEAAQTAALAASAAIQLANEMTRPEVPDDKVVVLRDYRLPVVVGH